MKRVILIFEVKSYDDHGLVELWLKVTDNEWFAKYVPIAQEAEFESLGVFESHKAIVIADVLKKVFQEIGIECIEHAVSDD